MKTNKIYYTILTIILGFFGIGLINLFDMRFESGDTYPPYSSLRSDPLGTRILYESLQNIAEINISRNFTPLHRLKPEKPSTLFWLGSYEFGTYFNPKTITYLEHLIGDGARFIMAFTPQEPRKINEPLTMQANKKKEKADQPEDKTKAPQAMVSVLENWDIRTGYLPSLKNSSEAMLIRTDYGSFLPPKIDLHSAMYFEKVAGNWQTIYSYGNFPVVIEKACGKGSIVLVSDAYLFSNEALQNHYYPNLLSWMIGENLLLIFDETHLGIAKNLGIANLARKYRLHGLFIGFLLLIILFIWKNSYSLVPPDDLDYQKSDESKSKKDNTEGLISLLQRNIPRTDVVNVCIQEFEWYLVLNKMGTKKISELKKISEERKQTPEKFNDPVMEYQRICKIFTESGM